MADDSTLKIVLEEAANVVAGGMSLVGSQNTQTALGSVGLMGGAGARGGGAALAGGAGAAGLAGTAGMIGIAAQGISDAFNKVIDAGQALVNNFEQWTQSFGQFSPEVQAARANIEMMQVQRGIQRGQELGPQLADFTLAQDDLLRTIEDIRITLLKPFLPLLTKIIENLDVVLELLEPFIEHVGQLLEDILTHIDDFVIMIGETLKQIPGFQQTGQKLITFAKEYLDIEKRRENREQLGDLFTDVINFFNDPALKPDDPNFQVPIRREI